MGALILGQPWQSAPPSSSEFSDGRWNDRQPQKRLVTPKDLMGIDLETSVNVTSIYKSNLALGANCCIMLWTMVHLMVYIS